MHNLILAAMLTLGAGYNNPGVSGEVVALEAATSNASATVELKTVESLTLFTNATAEVVSYETAYALTVTNYNSYTGYLLPDEAFPLTFRRDSDGTNITVAGNEELTFKQIGSSIFVSYDGKMAMQFSATSPHPITSTNNSFFADYEFAGVPPVIGESPCLKFVYIPKAFTTNIVGYIDWDAFKDAQGRQRIIASRRFDKAITNTVVVAQVPAETFVKTNTLASVTTTDHFGTVTTNGYFFGGGIVVEGAGEGDSIKLIYK